MEVNPAAPVVASVETLVQARSEIVWSVQSNINEWSRWNPDISRATLHGDLVPGNRFRWKARAPLVSTLREVVPNKRLVWTGRAPGISTVHVWTFEEKDGGTLVRSMESREGLLVRMFRGPMQKVVSISLSRGLGALKVESEKRAAARSA